MIDYDDLIRIDLFDDLTEEELKSIREICSEERYAPGEFIFKEGSQAKRLYVLKEGKVSIEIQVGDNKHLSVFTISQGADLFGWSALVEPFKFTASARCVDAATVLAVDGVKLMGLIEKDYRMGFLIMRRILRFISQRVRDSRLQLIHCYYAR